ncbi:DUF2188 domain-containing protein [Jiangella endophytica]|uniref:DUF2188 domain-containing protein n=1 Tax=Jiangella endophytica TaxID=1623398 RepID=UPI000E340CF0|nr:DUF2188 domain-containing protein [Jiangella endophytica]
MAAGDIHTVPRGDRWANIFEDGDRLIVSAGTKETAARMGRELARLRGVRHVVHDREDRDDRVDAAARGRDLVRG